MIGFQFFAIMCVLYFAFLAYVYWETRDKSEPEKEPEKQPKYIISKNGYGQYFVRELCEIYYLTIFKEQCLMNMIQVEKAIKEYEEHQAKSKREEVKRIY